MSQEQHEQPAAAENGNDNNSSLAGSEWSLEDPTGTDGDGDNENGENYANLNRHQLMELEMANLKAKVQVLEAEQKSGKKAAEQRELATEQKLQESRQYCLEVSKHSSKVMEWLDKNQGKNWLDICWILFLFALSAYLSMTGRTDFQLANQKVEGMTKQMAILQEQQRLLQKDNLDMKQSIEQLTKSMAAFLEEKLGSEIAEELKAKIPEENWRLLMRLKALEQKAQMENNELNQTIQQNGLTIATLAIEVAQLKVQQNQPNSTIQTAQQDIEGVANEMALPKEQQQQKETIKSTHLIKVANPKGNKWAKNYYVNISPNGQNAKHKRRWFESPNECVVAEQGFPIYWHWANTSEIGTILYYYEIVHLYSSTGFRVGLSDGSIPRGIYPGCYRNSYAIDNTYDFCVLSGNKHKLERPKGGTKPEWNGPDVIGCGLLLNSKNKLAIFFTVNGILQGKQIPINPSSDRLYPTVMMYEVDLEANFGNNPAIPFKYDIQKCPGLVFD